MRVLLQMSAVLSHMQPAMPLAQLRAPLGREAPSPFIAPPPQGGQTPADDNGVPATALEAAPPPSATEKTRGFWGGMQQVGCRARDVWVL